MTHVKCVSILFHYTDHCQGEVSDYVGYSCDLRRDDRETWSTFVLFRTAIDLYITDFGTEVCDAEVKDAG